MKDTVILITTFLRDDHLFRCIESIRKYYSDIAIYVGDNGQATKEKTKFCKKHNCQYIELPFDSGVGGTRNKTLEKIPRKYRYVAIVEDDVVFTEKSRLETLRLLLSGNKSLGIAGGLLRLGNEAEQHYEARTYIKNKTHFIEKIERPTWKTYKGIRYFTPDLILNVFLAKHKIFDDCLWDPQFKTAFEHSDFFLRLKKTGWKVAYIPSVEIYHKPEGSNEKYKSYRQRPKGWVLFAEKWGVDKFKSSYNPDRDKVIKLSQCKSWKKNPKDRVLCDAIEALNTHKIKWWLEAGTCLGVVRENDFIEYDKDIDIGIAPGHIKDWAKIKRSFLKAGFEIYKEWAHENNKVELSLTRDGTKIDLFFLRKKGGFLWYGVFGPHPKTKRYTKFLPLVFPSHLFDNLKEVMFKGMVCYIPSPPEEYLTRMYGKDWRTPNRDYVYWRDCQAIDGAFFKKNKIVYISDAWDNFGIAHLDLIDEAKKIGNRIIAGVITDEVYDKVDIPAPDVNFNDRLRMLKALGDIHEVVKQEGITPARIFQQFNFRPDYIILTTEPDEESKGIEFIELLGGKVIHIPLERTKLVIKGKKVSMPKVKIAIGIKTFMREEKLFRTLDAIRDNFPLPYRLYIADDSDEQDISVKKWHLYMDLERQGHVVLRLPTDSGISFGRNAIVKQVKEKYVLMMDDDILYTDKMAVVKMFSVLKDKPETGLVAGVVKLEEGGYFGNKTYSQGIDFDYDRKMLLRNPSDKKCHKVNDSLYLYADQVVNFFLAKRELFDDVKWDNQFKIEWEHMDFFLELKKTNWKAAVCLDAYATHAKHKADLDYERYRRTSPLQPFLRKHDIVRVVKRW